MIPMQTMILPFSLCVAGGAAVALLVGACASPELTLHTLLVRPKATDTSRFQRAFRFSGARVSGRLDRPRIALRTSDSEVVALEQQRWVASFGSELHDVLSMNLATTLSAADAGSAAAPTGVPLYRIDAEMRSYDARPDQGVMALVMWHVSCDMAAQGASTAALICQTMFVLPVFGSSAAADSEAGVNAVASSM